MEDVQEFMPLTALLVQRLASESLRFLHLSTIHSSVCRCRVGLTLGVLGETAYAGGLIRVN